MRAWLLVLLLWVPVAGEVPLRIGHSGGVMADLAGGLRSLLEKGRHFHVTVVGPEDDQRASDDLKLLRGTLAGDFHVAWVRAEALANFHRPWGLLSIPYLFPDLEAERTWMQQGRLVASTRGKGLRALTAMELGPRCFLSRQPIRGLGELQGLQVSVPKDRFRIDFMSELEAQARPAFAPTREAACETNEWDRLFRNLEARYPHTLASQHGLDYAVLIVNEKAFSRLGAEEKAALPRTSQYLEGVFAGRECPPLRHATEVGPEERRVWRERLKPLRERSLRLIGEPWKALFP